MQSFVHISHVVLGFGAALAGIIALGVGKGSRWHRWAGWAFVGGMLLAAVTTYVFMMDRLLPLAIIQASTAIYALGTAILALNPHWSWTRRAEWAFTGFLVVIMAGIAATGIALWMAADTLALGPIVFLAILAYFAVLDMRYLRRVKVTRTDRLKRHALRMALAISETVRAPLLTFSDALSIPFPAIVFGSFLLVPLIYFVFTPAIVRGQFMLRQA